MPAPLTITAANSVYMLTIPKLFPVPQRLHGYAADAAFATEAVTPAEVVMGVDGRMSAGWVPVETRQTIQIMPDSDTSDMFEAWYSAQQSQREMFWANAIIELPGLGRTYECINGVLTSYTPIADVAKVLRARSFSITWESVVPGPF